MKAYEIANIVESLNVYESCFDCGRGLGDVTINNDGTLDVKGSVKFFEMDIISLPFNFNIVSGDFLCVACGLKTLKGCPNFVGGSFVCSFNMITSLIGCPKEVEKDFSCNNNMITSLKDSNIKYVGGDFYCHSNELTSLEGSPKYVAGVFDCSNNKKIKSLKGIKTVNEIVDSDIFTGLLRDYKGEL